MKKALITGASSGIGAAIAQRFSKRGYHLILCGRNAANMDGVLASLPSEVTAEVRLFDVRDQKAVFDALEDIGPVDILINNAGNAHGLSQIQTGDLADWDAMIDINVKGLLYIYRRFYQACWIGIGHYQYWIFSGKDVYANGTVYCASKKAVDAITEGMRKDLHETGIKVGAVHPGLVETNFSIVRFKG